MRSFVGGVCLVVMFASCAKKPWIRYDPEFVSNEQLIGKIQDFYIEYGNAGRLLAACKEAHQRENVRSSPGLHNESHRALDPCLNELTREHALLAPLLEACQAYCDRQGDKNLPVGCPPITPTPFGRCYR